MQAKQQTASAPGKSLRIGAVAQQLGISASMIRGWERLGLARPERARAAGHRVYTPEDVRVLRRAVYLRRVQGLNVTAILMQLRAEGLLTGGGRADAAGPPAFGSALRSLRLQRGDSLAKVARAAGVSVGFLSNLERSQTGVSVGIMHKLARYYGRNILDFFNQDAPTGPLVRAQDRKILPGGEGVQMELLAWGRIVMEPHLFRVAPGAGSHESYSHDGEEFLYLVAGALAVFLNDEEFRLGPGDSFYFESKTPHRWFNPGRKETVVLWINTPPTF